MKRLCLVVLAGILAGCAGPSAGLKKLPVEPAAIQAHRSARSTQAPDVAMTQAPVQPQRPTGTARVAFVGDIILARGVASRMKRHGLDWPLELATPLLKSADLAVANLESPAGENPIPYVKKSVLFRAEPSSLDALKNAGIGLVSLANNHLLDYGPEVAGRTEAELDARGIAHAGLIREEGDHPRVDLQLRGLKIAFLSYCGVCHEKFRLKGSAPGTAPAVLAQMRPAVRKASAEADVVIVALHWGQEYYGANDLQRKLAAALARAGADIVVGHHAHVVQKVEYIGDTLVLYGLGNFVFDQRKEITMDSMLAMVTLEKGRRPEYEIHPMTLKDRRPRPLAVEEGAYARIQWLARTGYDYSGRMNYPEWLKNFDSKRAQALEATMETTP